MLLVVLERDNIVTAGVESNGIIPLGFFVFGPDCPLTFNELGIICHENVWSDAGDMTYEQSVRYNLVLAE